MIGDTLTLWRDVASFWGGVAACCVVVFLGVDLLLRALMACSRRRK